jgi:hypothetical protein
VNPFFDIWKQNRNLSMENSLLMEALLPMARKAKKRWHAEYSLFS